MPNHKNRGVKMILCVNMSLKMKSGKIAAQAGHATIGLYKQIMKKNKCKKMLECWEATGTKKIAVKLKDEGEMNLIASKATDAGIEFCIITDAGRTQVAAGSRTIIALIDYENKLNTITSRLKLL